MLWVRMIDLLAAWSCGRGLEGAQIGSSGMMETSVLELMRKVCPEFPSTTSSKSGYMGPRVLRGCQSVSLAEEQGCQHWWSAAPCCEKEKQGPSLGARLVVAAGQARVAVSPSVAG